MKKPTSYFLGCFVFLICTSLAFGQAQIGSLLFGTVTDAHGAVIPGGTVTYTNPATGATRTVKTGVDGAYVFQQIPAGVYDLTVSAAGFKVAKQSAIEVRLDIGDVRFLECRFEFGNQGLQVNA